MQQVQMQGALLSADRVIPGNCQHFFVIVIYGRSPLDAQSPPAHPIRCCYSVIILSTRLDRVVPCSRIARDLMAVLQPIMVCLLGSSRPP